MQRGVTEDGYVPTPPAETVTEIRAENIGGDDFSEVATVKATLWYWDGVEEGLFTVAETPFQNNGFTLQLNSVPNNFLRLIREDSDWFDYFTISDEDARWGILSRYTGIVAYNKNDRRIGRFWFMEDNTYNEATWIYSDRDVVITASSRSEWYDDSSYEIHSEVFSQSSSTRGITGGTLRGTNHRATSTRSGSRVWEETWDLNLGQGWNIVYISDIWTETSEKFTLTSQKPDDMNLRWIFSSWEDGRPPEDAISRVSQFVYDGMAMFYLWNEQMLDREPTAHDTDPKAYFNSLLYRLDRERQWSWITDDVNSLLNSFSGTATGSLGLAPIFLWLPNGIHLVGAVRYVYQGTAAYEVGIRRGDIITEIDGRPITLTNAPLLLEGNARITLTVFDQNFENRREVIITPRPFQANPVLHSSIREIEGRRIGYLFYTAFRSNFNEELFEVFREFQQAGITDLVLDLRYNPGGDVSAATYLASMIAPRAEVQNRSVFTILNYNRFINEAFDRQGIDRSTQLGTFNDRFPNPIDANLDLDNVFIIATRSSASASELITFCLRPHMNVVHIGELTSGKYTASWTVHAFDNFTEHGVHRAQRVHDPARLTAAERDKLRNWAMQPIVAIYTDKNGNDFAADNGLIPDHSINSLVTTPHLWRPIGDVEDYLFAKAISLITGLPYVETPLRSASDIQLRSTELRSSAEERLRRAVNLDDVEPIDPEILRQILLDFEF
jgi:C-terminal processing protease CtpA/Prc